jgi:hypothetical protein
LTPDYRPALNRRVPRSWRVSATILAGPRCAASFWSIKVDDLLLNNLALPNLRSTPHLCACRFFSGQPASSELADRSARVTDKTDKYVSSNERDRYQYDSRRIILSS